MINKPLCLCHEQSRHWKIIFELFFVVVVDVVLLGFYLLYMTREILSFLKAQCLKFSGKIGIYRGLHDS